MFKVFKMKMYLKFISFAVMGCMCISCQSTNSERKKDESMNVVENQIKCVVAVDSITQVGESPIWDYKYNRLLWIDTQGSLFIYTPQDGKNREVKLDRMIGTVVPYKEDTVLVGLQDGIYEMSLTTKELKFIADPEGRDAGNRYNDGKCDAEGRLWIGSMDKDCTPLKAGFFLVNPDASSKSILKEVTISNGVIWSPDNSKMFYQDTPTRNITAFDFDKERGGISNRQEIIHLPDSLGTPDGNTIDEEGMVWVANWDAACVTRWNPYTGELLQRIDVPALNVTAVAFGGENLEDLYITTASLYMPEDKASNYPQAGKLFVVKPGVRGIKCNYWKYGDK